MLASMRIDRLYGTSSAADKAFSGAAAPAAVPVAPVAVVFQPPVSAEITVTQPSTSVMATVVPGQQSTSAVRVEAQASNPEVVQPGASQSEIDSSQGDDVRIQESVKVPSASATPVVVAPVFSFGCSAG